ncbi:MAG: primosomal protein N' [bacterium]|nr:primosomal protein N' [bacterium]
MLIRVALPRSAPEALIYRVPADLEPFATPGVRVRVQVKQRKVTGLIVETNVDCDLADSKIREIVEIMDSESLLPKHLLDIAAFVSGYYRCGLGDTLAAMLPASLLRSDSEEVRLTPTGAALAPDGLSAAQQGVLELLRESGSMKMPTLLSRLRTTSRTVVRDLQDLGAVRLKSRRRDRAPQVEVAAVRLRGTLEPEELLAQCSRAPKQQVVIEWLLQVARPALVQDVCSATGTSPSVIAALAKKGLVERFTQLPPQRSRWSLPGATERFELTDEQQIAVDCLLQAVSARRFESILLEGVTGAGKTEVYLRALEEVVRSGGTGLVMVPEIGLTPAVVGAVEARFGSQVALMHSAQTDGERWREWRRIHRNEVSIVVGPRSALFAPMSNLGLIVIDEEHDGAYKQQEAPRYHARDMALVVARELGIPALMCTATPSTEAAALLERGLAQRLVLSRRVAGGTLPEVEIVDLRKERPDPGEQGRTLFSKRLHDALGGTLERGEQAILLMQRRGWAPTLLCRDCGHRVQCPSCSVSLVVHRQDASLRCHYCGYTRKLPSSCPQCGGGLLDAIGAGTEKVAHRFAELYPDIPVGVLDRDVVRRRTGLEETLGSFASGKTRVLIGTQMVAKGHHFPNVTLTGVISADAMLSLPDFRAGERTFQLLTQVGGRAGRGTKPGRVILQTYYPDHPAVRHAAQHDTASFLEEELLYRSAFSYPPAARMILARFESASEGSARKVATAAARAASSASEGVRVRGPAPAPLEKIRNRWRWQVILTASNRASLRPALAAIESLQIPSSVHRVIDVDPLSTL